MNRAGAGIESQDFEPVPAHHLDGAAVLLPFLGRRLFFELPPVLPAGEENPAYIQCRNGEEKRRVEKRIAEACVRFSVWVRRHTPHLPRKIVKSKWADAIIAAFRSSKLSFEFRGEVAERLKAAVC